jgi:poly(ADP-ribose) glycohydrolase ARH3
MLGVGIGDALGFPAEGRSPAENDMVYGAPISGYLPRIGRRHSWPVGQVTKDTQLTVLLAESLVGEKRLYMDDFAERLVRWLPSALKAGKATTHAIENLQNGQHWAVSGINSNGVGGTVRAVPLALFHHRDYWLLRQEAILQCMPTHAASKAYAGTVLFATAIASLVNTPSGHLQRTELLGLLDKAIRGLDAEMTGRLLEVATLLNDEVPAPEVMSRFRTGGYIMECLPSALYCFLYHAENPERALLTAANGGFDATTVAAIVGALSGAYHGRAGLPRSLERELPVAPMLIDLGTRLHDLVVEQEALKTP